MISETNNRQDVKSVYPGKPVRYAYAYPGRYITQSPQCFVFLQDGPYVTNDRRSIIAVMSSTVKVLTIVDIRLHLIRRAPSYDTTPYKTGNK